MGDLFSSLEAFLQRREDIALPPRQHGEGCIGSESQFVYGVGSRNRTFHSGIPGRYISTTGKVERAQADNQRDNDEELLDQTKEKNVKPKYAQHIG